MKQKSYFTSVSVTEGHPDKLCDQISDRILDELLKQDPETRCDCEVLAEPGAVHIVGEITTDAQVDYEACARDVIGKIGYVRPEYGFTDQCKITCSLHCQSEDIARGVDHASDDFAEEGAGNQGTVFGYAFNETETYMPLPIKLANDLTRRLTYVRKIRELPYLRPDGKSQVTVEYRNGVPARIEAVVLCAQHDPDITMPELVTDLLHACLPAGMMDEHTRIFINPTGRFVLGGPAADTGLTGRKIIADTYGGYGHQGGGSFSGKDPSKVDRSASYMARFIAKHIVAAGLADHCEIQLVYVIGVAQPISIVVDTFGSGTVADETLETWISDHFDLRPRAITERLELRSVPYQTTSAYGHFGKGWLPWEKFDDALLSSLRQLLPESV